MQELEDSIASFDAEKNEIIEQSRNYISKLKENSEAKQKSTIQSAMNYLYVHLEREISKNPTLLTFKELICSVNKSSIKSVTNLAVNNPDELDDDFDEEPTNNSLEIVVENNANLLHSEEKQVELPEEKQVEDNKLSEKKQVEDVKLSEEKSAPIELGKMSQVVASKLGKNDYIMIRENPCKIISNPLFAKVGKGGAGKAHFVGVNIFTGVKEEFVTSIFTNNYVGYLF